MSAPSPVDAPPLRWLVIGTGRAGQARIRDLQAGGEGTLTEAVGARAGEAAILAAIGRDDVDAVAVCTDNASHVHWVRAALEAGHHALCEFPLAATAAEAESLFALAAAQRRVLHVEFIGLLTDGHRGLAAQRGAIARLDVDFCGGRYRWIDADLLAGRVGQLAIGRLTAITDLLGPLTLASARLRRAGDVSALEVELCNADGRVASLRETRGTAVARTSRVVATDAAGGVLTPLPVESLGAGLFAHDLRCATRRMRTCDASGAYVDDATVVAVTALAEAISARVRR